MNIINSCLIGVMLLLLSPATYAQQSSEAHDGMTQRERNYKTFTATQKHTSEEAQLHNRGFEHHPELGLLFAEAPSQDCFELIGERTEMTKTFLREGTNGTYVMHQTSSESMHYRSGDQWMTIKTNLEKKGMGIYAASAQPIPVTINAKAGFTSLGKEDAILKFNSHLELIYLAPDGSETSLGPINWKNHTAGDDGVFVTDAWPGIDMEVYVARGTAKTNFYINHPLPSYAAGKLLVRDHMEMDGLSLYAAGQTEYKGNLEVRNKDSKAIYLISAATAYEKNNIKQTLQLIGYNIHANTVDIVLPGNFLNRSASAYPIVIDPLVTTATASAVNGSSYSPTNTVSCNYVNAATVPPNVTVTDVRWSFNYVASGGALLLNGAVDFTKGTCRSPGVASLFWFCNLPSAGTCTGTNVSIFPEISPCIPSPQCASYPLNLTMRFYQNFATTAPCATTYISAGSPLTITVHGRTIETSSVSSAGGLNSICMGQSVTLSTTPSFGVAPYTYVWNPGGTTGSPAVLTPLVSTNYTVTVTDACGQTTEAQQAITVTPLAPVTGINVVCVGATTTLSNPSGTGTWSSSNGSIAVVGPSTGIVTGVAAGTATISFVNPVGCYATMVVTVLAMPDPIVGPLNVCVTNTVTLSNPMPGGTWSSSTTPVALVGAGTGIVSGVSPGTSTISYSTSPGCTATAVVTVHPNPSIASVSQTSPSGCGAADGTITLYGLTPGATYTVTYTAGATPITVTINANASGQVVITGLTAGSYSSISVTSAAGCTGVLHGTMTLTDIGAPPAPTITTNAPICDGQTLVMSATSTPGSTFSWSGPGGFISVLPNPVISPANMGNAGTYTVIATYNGCVSLPATVTIVINPVPVITNIQFTNPVTCGGSEGTITLEGLIAGVTYNVSYLHDGTPVTVSITADASGNVTITGLPKGFYSDFSVESFTCVGKSERPVTLIDPASPPPPVITSNAPICVGLSLLLFGTDDKPGGTYYWEGPNGFISTDQNPVIPGVTIEAEGTYTLTYTRLNCKSKSTGNIKLQPVIKIKDINASKYQIPYGDSVQLYATGATYYVWTPHNKTLTDPYIYNPIARPQDSITVYTVHGTNEWGCTDSASITIRVVFDEQEYIPNSFTPNGDGLNDVFRIGKMRFKKLIDFTIYNRWGQEVYHNPYDPNSGWDGTSNGVKQDIGVYYYSIIIESASGKMRYYKGDVTLLR